MGTLSYQKKKKRHNKDQWLDFKAKEIHIKNKAPNFYDNTVNHARKLPRKTVHLLFLDVSSNEDTLSS